MPKYFKLALPRDHFHSTDHLRDCKPQLRAPSYPEMTAERKTISPELAAELQARSRNLAQRHGPHTVELQLPVRDCFSRVDDRVDVAHHDNPLSPDALSRMIGVKPGILGLLRFS